MTSSEFNVSVETEPGAILDRAIRKANLLDMVDCYLGAQVDYASGEVSVFFTKDATRLQLESLEKEVQEDDLNVQFEQVEDEVAGWVLKLIKVVEAGETQAAAAGEIAVDVPLSGKVDVAGKSSPSPDVASQEP